MSTPGVNLEGPEAHNIGQVTPVSEPVLPAPQRSSRSLKEIAESNPWAFILTAVVASVGVSAGIQQYFYAQQSQAEERKLSALSERLASIHRDVAGLDYLDVRNLTYSKSGASSKIPTGSHYYEDGPFFATTNPEWEQSRSTEGALFEDLTGEDTGATPLGRVAKTVPIELWHPKAKPLEIEGSPLFNKIYPYVMLETLSFEQLNALVGKAANAVDEDGSAGIGNADLKQQDDQGPAVDRFSKYIRSDAVGSLFTFKLFGFSMVASQQNDISFSLGNVQKVGNVLYSEELLTFHHVKVGGKNYKEYYLRQEIIIIASSKGISLIITVTPSGDFSFRDPDSAVISEWLQDFRAVVD